jgi:hypothetical protein
MKVAMVLFQGAVTGLLIGLVLSLWIGFGGPKPPPKMLPMSTESCSTRMQTDMMNMSASSGVQMTRLIQNVTTEVTRTTDR